MKKFCKGFTQIIIGNGEIFVAKPPDAAGVPRKKRRPDDGRRFGGRMRPYAAGSVSCAAGASVSGVGSAMAATYLAT